jgi:DNA repair exonuclease SbcCD nuclease subunit
MIKKIIHLSDIHVRTFQLHDLYKNQFQIFLNEIRFVTKDLSIDELRIVITGDLVHNKINISNEQMLLIAWFLTELSKIGIVVIIPGNHDFLENNPERMDSITPIIEMLNNSNIKFYKDWGVYPDENIKWVVYSLYQHNQRPTFNNTDDSLYIGLFHGQVQGVSTDLGFTFDDGYDRLNFLNLDILLCGDIHKRQSFDIQGTPKGFMVGSFIQQDHGETIKHHGYGVYDVESNKYTFHDLPNDQPFLHFLITDIKDLDNGKEILVNLG